MSQQASTAISHSHTHTPLFLVCNHSHCCGKCYQLNQVHAKHKGKSHRRLQECSTTMTISLHVAARQYLSDSHFAGLPVRLRLASVLYDLGQGHDTPCLGARLQDLLHALLGLCLVLTGGHGLQAPCVLCGQLQTCCKHMFMTMTIMLTALSPTEQVQTDQSKTCQSTRMAVLLGPLCLGSCMSP